MRGQATSYDQPFSRYEILAFLGFLRLFLAKNPILALYFGLVDVYLVEHNTNKDFLLKMRGQATSYDQPFSRYEI